MVIIKVEGGATTEHENTDTFALHTLTAFFSTESPRSGAGGGVLEALLFWSASSSDQPPSSESLPSFCLGDRAIFCKKQKEESIFIKSDVIMYEPKRYFVTLYQIELKECK